VNKALAQAPSKKKKKALAQAVKLGSIEHGMEIL